MRVYISIKKSDIEKVKEIRLTPITKRTRKQSSDYHRFIVLFGSKILIKATNNLFEEEGGDV